MKLKPLAFLLSGLSLAFAAGCQTGASSAALDDGRVTVDFQDSRNFTDFKDTLVGTDIGRENLEHMVRRMVQEEAAPYVKEGQRLSITFTDIDLAGDYLPTAASGRDIRVIKEVYPPRMRFRYTLTDASGAVIKQGQPQLQDLSFQYNTGINRDDELFYDRNLLRDWVRKDLRG